MAAKKKKKVKYTGEVGHIVQVTWIDSGWFYNRSGVDPENCDVGTCVTYGKLVHSNKKRIVVAMDTDVVHANPYNERYKIIWRPSIQKIRRLR